MVLNSLQITVAETTLPCGKTKVTEDLIITFRANYISPYFTYKKDDGGGKYDKVVVIMFLIRTDGVLH